ncbi:hypothetical protein [Kribbella deserti]|uniref:DUF2470 domain-containing protein n=1 Tax=Kribbella deserti TaxID=1926257 RepID=A0ABV6QGI8_9ACTN
MALSIGKRDIAKMVTVLNKDHADMATAALAALEAALAIFEAKAKYTVVGQLHWKTGPIDADEAASNRVALGWYATVNQADKDAYALTYSPQTHETFRAWTVPVHHGTPAAYYAARKQVREAAEASLRSEPERELQRRQQWFKDHPDTEPPADWGFIWKTGQASGGDA